MSRVPSLSVRGLLRSTILPLVVAALTACDDLPTEPGALAGDPVSSGMASLTLDSHRQWVDVRFGPCGSGPSGENRLGSSIVDDVAGSLLWYVTPGCYDIRLRAIDGHPQVTEGVALTAGEAYEMSSGARSTGGGASTHPPRYDF